MDQKILVVDDELVSRKKMKKILTKYGVCTDVDTGQKAVLVFARALQSGEPFDMISLDIGLPDANGTEVVLQIRKLEEEHAPGDYKAVKILMVTGRSDRDSVLTSIQAGCDQYVIKPIDPALIAEKLTKMNFI